MTKTLFELMYHREPQLEVDDSQARQIQALERALHDTTPDRPGTPMGYAREKFGEKEENEPEWW